MTQTASDQTRYHPCVRAIRRNGFHLLAVVCALAISSAIVVPQRAHAELIDRQLKIETIDALHQAPCITWHGSSTSREVNPAQITAISGHTAFNASITAGRPYDHDYFARYIAMRFPAAPVHHIIGLDVEQFIRKVDESIYHRRPGSHPQPSSKFTSAGFRLRNPYKFENYAMRKAYIMSYYREEYRKFPATLSSRHKRYLRRMLTFAQSTGDTPTIVLMPVHPDFIRAFHPLGRDVRRGALREWLRSLKRDGIRFRFLDMTYVRSFGGTAAGFYDPVHMRPENVSQLINRMGQLGELQCSYTPTVVSSLTRVEHALRVPPRVPHVPRFHTGRKYAVLPHPAQRQSTRPAVPASHTSLTSRSSIAQRSVVQLHRAGSLPYGTRPPIVSSRWDAMFIWPVILQVTST